MLPKVLSCPRFLPSTTLVHELIMVLRRSPLFDAAITPSSGRISSPVPLLLTRKFSLLRPALKAPTYLLLPGVTSCHSLGHCAPNIGLLPGSSTFAGAFVSSHLSLSWPCAVSSTKPPQPALIVRGKVFLLSVLLDL